MLIQIIWLKPRGPVKKTKSGQFATKSHSSPQKTGKPHLKSGGNISENDEKGNRKQSAMLRRSNPNQNSPESSFDIAL
jgi:hypothetical protein